MLRKIGPVAMMIACTAILLLHDFFGHHHHDFQWVETSGHHHHDGAAHHPHDHDLPDAAEHPSEIPSHPEGVGFSIYHYSRQSVSNESIPARPDEGAQNLGLLFVPEPGAFGDCHVTESKPPDSFRSLAILSRYLHSPRSLRAPPRFIVPASLV